MNKSVRDTILKKIHWTTSEEMMFTPASKYGLALDKDFPMAIRFYQFTSAKSVIPNYHDFYEISYFHAGKGVYHFADQSFDIRPGMIVLIQSGTMHHVDADPNDSLKTASIYFMPELVFHAGSTPHEYNYLLPFLFQMAGRPPVFNERELGVSIWKWTLKMYEIMQNAEKYYQLHLKVQLCEMILTFLSRLTKHPDNRTKAYSAPMDHIKRLEGVFKFIQEGYARSISLEQLAEIAHISPGYFCRYFKGVTGLSPIEYVLRYRIDKAKELLIDSGEAVTEICFQVGFSSQSYFDRVFKRYTNLSPKHFRQTYSPSKFPV